MNALRGLLIGALVCAAALSRAADPVEVHGASDLFDARGVAIAWGVLRGASEETTLVVVRVAADAGKFSHIAVEGVDPFTRQRHTLLAGQPLAGTIDVRIPRTRFADLPRSEIRLYGSPEALQRGAPSLMIYYLSIPDTTPEFATEAALGAYLDGRIAKAKLR